jgi:hypothetical protein
VPGVTRWLRRAATLAGSPRSLEPGVAWIPYTALSDLLDAAADDVEEQELKAKTEFDRELDELVEQVVRTSAGKAWWEDPESRRVERS